MRKQTLVYHLFVRSTPKKVWAALTSPKSTRQYWGGMSNHSDWAKGSDWTHLNPKKEVWIQGSVLESEPPLRLVLSWADPDNLKDQSRVTFALAKVENLVELTVTHDQLKAGSKMHQGVSWGWPRVLSSLKSYLETGQGINIFAGGKRCDAD